MSVAPPLAGLPVPFHLLAKLMACLHVLAGQCGLLRAQIAGPRLALFATRETKVRAVPRLRVVLAATLRLASRKEASRLDQVAAPHAEIQRPATIFKVRYCAHRCRRDPSGTGGVPHHLCLSSYAGTPRLAGDSGITHQFFLAPGLQKLARPQPKWMRK